MPLHRYALSQPASEPDTEARAISLSHFVYRVGIIVVLLLHLLITKIHQ